MSAILASIGTTHPWNIAGTGLDARVAFAYDLHCVTAVAAVSAQDARGLHALEAIGDAVVRAQLDALPSGIGAYRIGSLGTAQNVREVARFLRANAGPPVVVDPVFSATLGGSLADDATRTALRDELCSLPEVILTPNLLEAAALLDRPIPSADGVAEYARALQSRGARAVILKGGHLAGDPVDVFSDAGETRAYSQPRLPGSMRGTGCVLAAALACELARGIDLRPAVESARAFVRERIAAHALLGDLQVAF